jgi:TPR repeat protein
MHKNGDEQKVMLLREEAARGNARAQRLLALRYWRGRGMEQNFELAAYWMHNAAAHGLSLAHRDLAGFYLNGVGVHPDPAKALELFQSAASQGDPIAKKYLEELKK